MGSNTQFYVKDCALSAIALGEQAGHLKELYDKLRTIHPGCIYYHFWGGRLRPHFEAREYHNDFAMWAYSHLHDEVLAERLSLIDPTDYQEIEGLRKAILAVIETRLDETEQLVWLPKARHFHFVRSKILVFDTPYVLSSPDELIQVLPRLTLSSIFYHFIDACRRPPAGHDDFSLWLHNFPDTETLIEKILSIDFYFTSLDELKNSLFTILANHFVQGNTHD